MTGKSTKNLSPYPVEKLGEDKLFVENTICCLLRDIYLRTSDKGCLMAIRMAKNMMLALVDYKQMLVEQGFGIAHDKVEAWQFRPKHLYRGKRYRRSKRYE